MLHADLNPLHVGDRHARKPSKAQPDFYPREGACPVVTLTIEKAGDPNPLSESGIALVFPKMAGRAVGCVAMLVKRDDATKPFLAPSGWQAGEYRWLSGPVRNDGQDLIVPLEESVTRLVGRSARLRVVLLDAGIEGVTAATEPAVPEQDEPQSAPPPPPQPAVVAQPALAAAPPGRLRRIAPAGALVALVALIAVGAAIGRYAPPRAAVALPVAATAVPELAAAVRLSPASAIAAEMPAAGSTVRGPERYWVQFGAFSRPELAQHVKKVLGESGIATAVATVRAVSGELLFVVRSVQFPDRDSALALGHRGQRAAKVDFLLRRVEPNHAGVVLPSRLAIDDHCRDREGVLGSTRN